MIISELKQHTVMWLKSSVVGIFTLLASTAAYANNSSWMEDNSYLFRNNTLETLSLPASHDAGMYSHDLNLFEIGVKDLRIDVQLTSIIKDFGYDFSKTGVIEAGDLLDIFHDLLSVVRAVDNLCIYYIVDTYCLNFGLEGLVWDWVGKYYGYATGKPGDLSITQNLDLYGQLSSGIRMFDLRPKWQRGNLYVQHSQADIKDVGGEINISKSLKVLDYTLASVSAEAGGEIRSFSATGPLLDKVLADIRRYMLEGHREFIVLDFSHYWAGYNGTNFTESNYNTLVERVKSNLGDWLLTEDMLSTEDGTPEERLAEVRLPELIGQQGHILAMFDTNNIFLADPKNGIWPNNIYALQGDGSWANKDDFDDLISVLETDFLTAESDRFELWWTLTCQADKALECSVRELAGKVNPHLKDFVDSLDIPNDNGNTINEIWVDFAEETAATEIAIRLTPIAIDIDIKPENNHNPINPRAHGVVWVALLSDTETSMDALQVDIPTVRFGAAGAMANLHKVKDVNRDGLADLLLRFQVSETYIDCENTEATLRGKTYDGQSILGIGFINTVGCSFHSGEMNQVTDSDLDSEVTAEVNDTKTSREVTSEVNVANIDSEVNTDATTLVQGSGGIFQPILLPLLLLFGYIRRNVNT